MTRRKMQPEPAPEPMGPPEGDDEEVVIDGQPEALGPDGDPDEGEGDEEDVPVEGQPFAPQEPPPEPRRRRAPRQVAPDDGMRKEPPPPFVGGVEPEDFASTERAAHNLAAAREVAAVAELYRIEPEDFHGQRTKGFIRKFPSPFDVVQIKDWARQHRGGGKYRLIVYNGAHRAVTSGTFDIEGDPLTSEQQEAVQHVARQHAQQQAQDAYAAPSPRAPHAGPFHDSDRERDLERRLAEERSERMAMTMQQQNAQMMQAFTAQMTALIAKVADQPRTPAIDLPALATALAPVLAEMVKRPAPVAAVDHTKDIVGTIQPMLAALIAGTKGETTNDKILNTLLAKALERPNNDSLAIDALKKTMPAIMETLMKSAMIAGGAKSPDKPEEEEFGPKYLAEKAMDMLGRAISQRGAPQGAAPAPGFSGAGGAAPALGAPVGTQGTPHVHPTMTGDPFAGNPGVIVPRNAAATPTPAQPAAVAQPAAAAASSDFAPDLFARALAALNAGKQGSQFADEIMEVAEDENTPPKAKDGLLSPRAVAFLGSMPAPQAAGLVLHDIQTAGNPAVTSLLDPIGQAFVLDFCRWFSGEEEK